MFSYKKMTNFPINLNKKDLKMAKYMLTALGGPAGEMAAAIRYFNQKFNMPDDKGKALLNDISTEEFGHCEMIGTIIHELMKGATLKELEENDLLSYYVDHGKGIYDTNASGVDFTVAYTSSTGNPIADLVEDMAAEQKARVSYENLINIASDKELINILLFLRQREIVHFNRFKELYEYYVSKGY